ncbi:hypothetical protein MRB53_040417 [Persea americana]|nr:hypothetical protein MRB53_040417 [Persea americana]
MVTLSPSPFAWVSAMASLLHFRSSRRLTPRTSRSRFGRPLLSTSSFVPAVRIHVTSNSRPADWRADFLKIRRIFCVRSSGHSGVSPSSSSSRLPPCVLRLRRSSSSPCSQHRSSRSSEHTPCQYILRSRCD